VFSALPQLWVEVFRRGRGGEPSTLGIYLLSALPEYFSVPSYCVYARGCKSRFMYIFESIFILIAFRRSFCVLQVTHFNRAPRCGKTCIIWIARSALQQSSAISISLGSLACRASIIFLYRSSLLVQLIADEGSKIGDIGDFGLPSWILETTHMTSEVVGLFSIVP
jgi:hypothetical protein